MRGTGGTYWTCCCACACESESAGVGVTRGVDVVHVDMDGSRRPRGVGGTIYDEASECVVAGTGLSLEILIGMQFGIQ